ncbi:MAG TPA: CGNR zinc finger domain-containing protein [Solirubrobacteraceae bacterium]|jgi:predicted RNA-binding Zn ribbon-like protein|nr:CGNR zinc finger domain-containing protein [Solirubrobacteraceae bacterium]
MKEASPAPNQLDLVIDFVNTLDVEEGTDELATPEALATWLAQRGAVESVPHASEADQQQAIRLREALRELMLANNGGPREDEAGHELELVARRGDLRVHFDAGGSIRMAPGAEGVAAGLARLLVPVARAVSDGSWQRVKACRADDCQWAFYDRSRNRSGVWCEMAVCGNRTKVRAYRERTPRADQ